jgi:CheY-like chemotaxis protein
MAGIVSDAGSCNGQKTTRRAANYPRNLPVTCPCTYDDLGMAYQALLFCPDEKSAHTLTQVLSDLDFSVEACTEPFAAVKKLMGQGFDALVVDCENEQNAALLFKSARNSASNQASLAVAVVEGQGGVAKAFRLGANLVLTKPINVEQSKGTLRVARGLLRKNEAAKPAANMAATHAVQPAKPAAAKTISLAKAAAAAQTASASVSKAPTSFPASSTFPAMSAPAVVSQPVAQDEVFPKPVAERSPAIETAAPAISSSGAASAPAPARIAENPPAAENMAEEIATDPAEVAASEPAKIVGSEPTFTFGGNVEKESSGKSKKILLLIASLVLLAAAGYVGWTQYQELIHEPANQQTPARRPSPRPASSTTAPTTPAAVPVNPATSGAAPSSTQTNPVPPNANQTTSKQSSVTTVPSIPQTTTHGPAQPTAATPKKPAAGN